MTTEPKHASRLSRRVRHSLRTIEWPIVVFASVILVAALGNAVSRQPSHLAAFWPVNGILFSGLLLSGRRRWPIFVVAACLGILAVDLASGEAFVTGLLFAIANCLGPLVAAPLLLRLTGGNASLNTGGFLPRFLLVGGLVAPLLSSALGTLLVGSGAAVATVDFWMIWLVADSMGHLLVVPVVLSVADLRGAPTWRAATDHGPLSSTTMFVAMAVIAVGVFWQSSYPVLFLLIPPIALVTFRLGPVGASGSVLITAIAGLYPSMSHQGPIGIANLGREADILIFQLLLVSALHSALPIGITLMDRRRLAKDLSQSEQRHLAILHGVSDTIYQTDAKGHWRFLNAGWKSLTGLDPQTMVGRSCFEFIHPDDRARLREAIEPLLNGSADECRHEVRYSCTSGGWRWGQANVRAERDRSGGFIGTYGTIADVTERREAEAQRREEEARYRAIFDTAVDAIVIIDVQGTIHSFNPAGERIFGFAAHEVIGHNVTCLMPSEFTDGHDRHVSRSDPARRDHVLGRGRVLRGQRKDGSQFPIEVAVTRWQRGGDTFFTGVMRDISARKAAEDELRATSARLHESNRLLLLAEATGHLGHWTIDTVTGRQHCSDEVYRIHGLDISAELDAEQVFALFHPEDAPRLQAVFERLHATGETASVRGRIVRPNGEIRHVMIQGSGQRDGDGVVGALFGVIQDVTAQVEAELAARESETRFRMLAENASDMILCLDLADRCTYASPAVLTMTGFRPEETLGQDVIASIHPEDRARVRSENDWLKRGEVDQLVVEYRGRGKDGSLAWLEARSRRLHAPDGRVMGIISVVRDVTARKALEQDLMRARDAAEAGARAKADFLATMSHELRTPMTGVLGMIDLLRADPTPEERLRYFDTLASSAATMMQVVNDILDFSKIEAGQLTLEQVDFDLVQLVEQTIDLYRSSASQRGVRLDASVASGGVRFLRGDSTRIRQLLSNLVGNAVKFTERGRISVRVEPVADAPDARWRFSVRDSGIGIAPDMLPHLFEAFTQADSSTTRRFGGTGLGLTICKKLAHALGGTIEVESELGRGSTFRFELPLPEGVPIEAAKPDRSAFAPARRPLRILLAEDNSVNQLLVTSMLGKMGHAVSCAANGRIAVEMLGEGAFDLVLMDMQMPVMDGPEAIRAIRALPGPVAAIPIVALTADVFLQRADVREELTLDGFLAKPIERQRLQAELERVASRLDGKPLETNMPATAPKSVSGHQQPLLDLQAIARLRASLGEDTVDELLRLLIMDVRSQIGTIPVFLRAGQTQEAARVAHAIRGAAGNLSAAALAAAASAVEGSCTSGVSDCLVEGFLQVAEATCQAAEALAVKRAP